MHHRDGPGPTAEHPPVLIKAEEAGIHWLWPRERNVGEPAGVQADSPAAVVWGAVHELLAR